MARNQPSFVCAECGNASLKWQGQCPACNAWNSLQPVSPPPAGSVARPGLSGGVIRLADIKPSAAGRRSTGIGEFDRVLGGGLVPGSVVLVGGAPGIGKSTLLLQVAGCARSDWPTLYASGEESADQVALRARRLGIAPEAIAMMSTTDVDEVTDAAKRLGVACLIIDSIQTMGTATVPSVPGSPNQLRECAARLIHLAKSSGVAVILIGHVTKEGVIAGPRMLEHMVDAVLYFEDEAGSRFRLLRSVKNRFGAANELGVFAMQEEGLREVRNPSAIFLADGAVSVAGSVVTALHQGSRPLLVEVQALTDQGGGGPPRRLAVGVEPSRLALLLAALHRHAGIGVHDQDVFVNVVGGIRVMETAADLAIAAAIVSSRGSRPIPRDTLVFGEVGLGGEIRPVPYGEERIKEAAKLGFRRVVLPVANRPRKPLPGTETVAAASLVEALAALVGAG